MIDLTGKRLSLDTLRAIIFDNQEISINSGLSARVKDSFNFLEKFAQDKLIYGINTGLGPMTQYRINETDLKKLQYNLIRSHSSGCGAPISVPYVRASMLARLNSLVKGFSGINIEAVEMLQVLINKNIFHLY